MAGPPPVGPRSTTGYLGATSTVDATLAREAQRTRRRALKILYASPHNS